jgi:hypothetical protein
VAYFLVEDFAGGIDLRKSPVTAKPNTVRQLSNGFVNPGGEIEQRRKFAVQYTLPAGCVGLAGLGGYVYTFGLAPAVSVQLPFMYQQLTPSPALPGGVTISRILDRNLFGRKLYVIARFSDGVVRHFYDGAQVTDAKALGLRGKTHKSKLYLANGSDLIFSAVNAPTDHTGTGAGILDLTNTDFGTADLIGLEAYYNQLACFGLRTIQLWQMDPDPAQNQIISVLGSIGLLGGNALTRYGNGDVLFLSDAGIRSLRARDSSGEAVQGDIGSPIDELVRELRRQIQPAELEKVVGFVEPNSGTVWFVWKNKAIVLSYYPAQSVTAWSTYDLGFDAEYVTIASNRVFIQGPNNVVYSYGAPAVMGVPIDPLTASLGSLAAEHDTSELLIETPMLDFNAPATFKTYTALDVACNGVLSIEANFNPDPNFANAWVTVATIYNNTYGQARVPMDGYSTHVAFRIKGDQGFSRLGALVIHYTPADAE